MQALLDGVRVIDLTSVIMGPYCTMTLADLGAEVIKIEAPEGDMIRRTGVPGKTPGMGPIHMTVGRGKRSVVLDLKQSADRDVMRELLATADVFIHNVRGKAIDRLGFGYDDVRAINPRIVYVHCMGYAAGGPYSDLPAYDDVIQAVSGLTTLISRVDGDPAPRFLPTAIADKVTGLHAVYGTLAALFNRERSGEGRKVEVAMQEAVTAFTMVEHLFGQTFVPPNGGAGFKTIFERHKQPFRTADGYLAIVVYTEAQIVRFLELSDRTEILADARFATPADRLLNLSALFGEMAAVTPTRTSAEWRTILADTDMPAMPITDLGDVIADPHLIATGFFRERVHPTEGRYRETAAPVHFSGLPETSPRPPARIGEHTAEVLAELRPSGTGAKAAAA